MRGWFNLTLAIALSGLAIAAHARASEKKSQGKKTQVPESHAEPDTVEQPKTAPPVACFTQAKLRTFLTDDESTRLCHCQHSARNVDCFLDAKHNTYLNDEQALQLCSGGHFTDLNCLD